MHSLCYHVENFKETHVGQDSLAYSTVFHFNVQRIMRCSDCVYQYLNIVEKCLHLTVRVSYNSGYFFIVTLPFLVSQSTLLSDKICCSKSKGNKCLELQFLSFHKCICSFFIVIGATKIVPPLDELLQYS